jgi:rhamnosyltransferase subunit B
LAKMARLILATSGSFGDLHPYLAVGLGLKARGHEVVVVSASSYRHKVTDAGLGFFPMRPDNVPLAAPVEVIRRVFDPRHGASFLLRQLVLPYVEETYRDLLEACEGADLLVSHPGLFPAPLVAEKCKLKWLSAVLSPGVFMSSYDPPVLPPMPWFHALRHLGPLPHTMLRRGMERATRGWMRAIDELRLRDHLRPTKHPMRDDMFSPYGTLAWFSPVLSNTQPDWPPRSHVTGFPFFDRLTDDKGLEPNLCAFLDRGPKPVVFTLGSSAVVDAGNFYEESLEAVKRLGCRAIMLVGPREALDSSASRDQNVLLAAYVPYSELFPKAAAIVHQGGIGTTGQAMRSGVPELVAPLGLDQPDNAYRVRRLGVARVLNRRRYRAAAVAEHLHVLLQSPSYQAAAQRVGAQVRSEDGVSASCEAIENVLAASALPT